MVVQWSHGPIVITSSVSRPPQNVNMCNSCRLADELSQPFILQASRVSGMRAVAAHA